MFHFSEVSGIFDDQLSCDNPQCLEVVSPEVCRTQDCLYTKASFTDTFDEAPHPCGSHGNPSLKNQ